MKEQQEKKENILKEALKLVPFEGWVPKILAEAAKNAGYDPGYAEVLFPAGVEDLVAFFIETSDKHMLEALVQQPLKDMKIRERIAIAVKTRILQHEPHRAAIPATLRFFALPNHVSLGSKLLLHTCSEMWYAAGDTSTDFNYYTKRFLLAGVYSSTLLYWLEDHSDGYKDTWEFLGRRINDALALGGAGKKVKERVAKLFPWS